MPNRLPPIPAAPDPVEMDFEMHGLGPVDGRAVFDEYLDLLAVARASGNTLTSTQAFYEAFDNVLAGRRTLPVPQEETVTA